MCSVNKNNKQFSFHIKERNEYQIQLKNYENKFAKNISKFNLQGSVNRRFRYISHKMRRYTIYLYLETALRVSGGISTHHQEHTQLYLHHLVLAKPLLLHAAVVEDLEQISN